VTLCTADFELGTNGSAIIAADPGSATAWDSVLQAGGDTATYDNTHTYGRMAAKFDNTPAPNSTNTVTWTAAIGTLTNWYGRVYLWTASFPTSTYRIAHDSGGNFPVYVNSDGTLAAFDLGGATSGIVPIALNRWVRIEWHWINSATVGQTEVKLFNTADSLAQDDFIQSAANRNTAASTTSLEFGLANGGNSAGPIWLDNIIAGATSYPGPAVVPTYQPPHVGHAAVA
jgi:hypothetical protein